MLDATLAADESVRSRFYQEAKAAAALRSPHVVQIIEYGVDQDLPFIAMELLEGETLAARLARVNVLPHAEMARIFLDLGRAVRRAHQAGIVHRDLKPENIFLVQNDDQEVAKVLDFGIAKTNFVRTDSRATQTGVLVGTLPYMSPEQARGAQIDHRTDLWALAVIAFECLCGRSPFTAENPGELVLQLCALPISVPSHVAEVPPGFDGWFAHATERDPSRRFQSAKELIEALQSVLGAAPPVSARPPSAAPHDTSRSASVIAGEFPPLRGSKITADSHPTGRELQTTAISAPPVSMSIPTESLAFPYETAGGSGHDTTTVQWTRPPRLSLPVGIALATLVGTLGLGIAVLIRASSTNISSGARASSPEPVLVSAHLETSSAPVSSTFVEVLPAETTSASPVKGPKAQAPTAKHGAGTSSDPQVVKKDRAQPQAGAHPTADKPAAASQPAPQTKIESEDRVGF
jgi:serine/threonine-protein kinase